jgi:hypothetical protein
MVEPVSEQQGVVYIALTNQLVRRALRVYGVMPEPESDKAAFAATAIFSATSEGTTTEDLAAEEAISAPSIKGLWPLSRRMVDAQDLNLGFGVCGTARCTEFRG